MAIYACIFKELGRKEALPVRAKPIAPRGGAGIYACVKRSLNVAGLQALKNRLVLELFILPHRPQPRNVVPQVHRVGYDNTLLSIRSDLHSHGTHHCYRDRKSSLRRRTRSGLPARACPHKQTGRHARDPKLDPTPNHKIWDCKPHPEVCRTRALKMPFPICETN